LFLLTGQCDAQQGCYDQAHEHDEPDCELKDVAKSTNEHREVLQAVSPPFESKCRAEATSDYSRIAVCAVKRWCVSKDGVCRTSVKRLGGFDVSQ